MNRESLNFKTNYFLSLIIVLLCFSIIIFFFYTYSLNKKINVIRTVDILFSQHKNSLASEINNLDYLLQNSSINTDEMQNKIYISLEKINVSKNFFANNYQDRLVITTLIKNINDMNSNVINYMELMKNGRYNEAKSILKLIDEIRVGELKTILTKDINQLDFFKIRLAQLLRLVKISYICFVLCLVIILVLVISHVIYLNNGLLKNLEKLNLELTKINSGESSILNQITVNSKDEIWDLAKNINIFENKVYEMITKIKNGAFSIQQSAEILNTYNDNIVKKSEDQKNEIELINANLSQIKKTINYNNNNTFKLNKLAKKTKKITEIINLEAKNLNNTIEIIFKSSEEIEKISTLIEELSFQTTILSLNSAVESTRIQKGSKSFDVMSNEIHRLSTMGKQAAKDIKNLSNENKIKIDESSFYLNNTVKLIETIVIKINEISILLDEITKSSEIETAEIETVLDSLKDVESLSNHTNSIAKDTLILGEKLNSESLNFLDIISFFNKELILAEKNASEKDIDNTLSQEEKERILQSFYKIEENTSSIEEEPKEKDYYEI